MPLAGKTKRSSVGRSQLDEARALVSDGLDRAQINASTAARELGYPASRISGWLGVKKPPRTNALEEGAALRLASFLHCRGWSLDDAKRFLVLLGYEGMAEYLRPQREKDDSVPASGVPMPQTWETSVPSLVERANRLADRGNWAGALAALVTARDSYRRGSRAWADLSLDVALQSQQSGDIEAAERYIEDVETEYLDGLLAPDLEMQAKVANRRGWILDGQIGDFKAAEEQFSESRQLSIIAEDEVLSRTNLDFLLKVRAKHAMALGQAYLGAYPRVPEKIPDDLRAMIVVGLDNDLPEILATDPNNPAHYRHEFMARALLSESDLRVAQKRILELEGLFREIGGEQLRLLCLARGYVSLGIYDMARGEAESAFLRYSLQHYAHGLAHSAAVWAHALQLMRSSNKRDWQNNYDLWVLVLLLHPYSSHPLSQEARDNLRSLDKMLRRASPDWVESYVRNLDSRLAAKEGLFGHLNGVFGVQTRIPISPYVLSIVTPGLIDVGLGGDPQR